MSLLSRLSFTPSSKENESNLSDSSNANGQYSNSMNHSLIERLMQLERLVDTDPVKISGEAAPITAPAAPLVVQPTVNELESPVSLENTNKMFDQFSNIQSIANELAGPTNFESSDSSPPVKAVFDLETAASASTIEPVCESKAMVDLIDAVITTFRWVQKNLCLDMPVEWVTESRQQFPKLLETLKVPLADREAVLEKLITTLFGYGPLNEFMADAEVQSISVNAWNRIVLQKSGVQEMALTTFESPEHYSFFMKKISTLLKGRSGYGPDYSLIRLVHAPDFQTMTVHKPVKLTQDLAMAIEKEAVSQSMLDILKDNLQQDMNVHICGGTLQARAAVMQVLVNMVDESYRLLNVESVPMVNPPQLNAMNIHYPADLIQNPQSQQVWTWAQSVLDIKADAVVMNDCPYSLFGMIMVHPNTWPTLLLSSSDASSVHDHISRYQMFFAKEWPQCNTAGFQYAISTVSSLVVEIAAHAEVGWQIRKISRIQVSPATTVVVQDLLRPIETKAAIAEDEKISEESVIEEDILV